MKEETIIHAGKTEAGFVVDERQPLVIVTKSVAQAKAIARSNPLAFTEIDPTEAKWWGAGRTLKGTLVQIQ